MPQRADWQIERFVLGELPAPELAALESEIEGEAGLLARVAAIEASNRALLAAHPPQLAAAAIRERAAAARPGRPSWAPRAFALAASLAVAAGGATLVRRGTPAEAPDATRTKGVRPHLAVFRQTQAGVEVLAEGTRAREGDLVQLTYQAAGRRFGVIVSIDGRGVVTVHHPREGRQAARLAPGQAARLSSAYRLDDAPGWERFVLVTSDEPFDVAEVVAAAAALSARRDARSRPLVLPSPLEQSSFTLSKDDIR